MTYETLPAPTIKPKKQTLCRNDIHSEEAYRFLSINTLLHVCSLSNGLFLLMKFSGSHFLPFLPLCLPLFVVLCVL